MTDESRAQDRPVPAGPAHGGAPALDATDEALVAALAGPLPGEDAGSEVRLLTLAELAERVGLPLSVLEAIEREGFLIPRSRTGERRYSEGDVRALEAGRTLLESGLPLGELLDLARRHDEAMRDVADHAVDLFVRFVRDPVQATAGGEQEAAQRLVTAFQRMLPATGELVGHHFRRLLLDRALHRLEAEVRGDEPDGPRP